MLLRILTDRIGRSAALSAILMTSISTGALAQSPPAADLPELVVETDKKPKKKKAASDPNTRLTNVGKSSGGGGGTSDAVQAPAVETTPSSDIPVAGGGGITGASTTVITREQIARAPQASLAEIIGREAGVQNKTLFGGLTGAGTSVDMRGFGATAPSNTLLLINGRRQNDWDLDGFDLSTIAKESIERIEITRGNSGAVLYGDGAVGGVINIVTRGGADLPNQARVEGGIGSFATHTANVSASGSSGPFSGTMFGNFVESDGYRDNNEFKQSSAVGDFRWSFERGSVFFNIGAEDQELGLPGARIVSPSQGINQVASNPRGTATPFDYGDKQGVRATLGFSYMLSRDFELIVDGGSRTKWQQFGTFSETGFPFQYTDTQLDTLSFTPRANVSFSAFGLPSRTTAGLDLYDTDYTSDRSPSKGATPFTQYDASQRTYAAYWQQTVSVLPTTDVSAGARLQRNETTASDAANPLFSIPLDDGETNHAWHVGAEHRLLAGVTVFGRLAESFRVPTIDERNFTLAFPSDFILRTQKSDDWELGARFQSGPFELQSSYYDMRLADELYFSPGASPPFGANINLDPTSRRGVETIASWRVMKDLRLRGNLTYTEAKFRAGPFAGNDIPLVSDWAGNAGFSWDIAQKWLTLDASVNYVGERRKDNDEANTQLLIKDHTTVDLRLGGSVDRFFWSASVHNVFDVGYFDYAISSTTVDGRYNAYTLPGRTFLLKAGATW
jgi:iron complex outermembrane receptor protein